MLNMCTSTSDQEKLVYFIEAFAHGAQVTTKAVRVGDRTIYFNMKGEVIKIEYQDAGGNVTGIVYP